MPNKTFLGFLLTVILSSCGGGGSPESVNYKPDAAPPAYVKQIAKVLLAPSDNPNHIKDGPEHNLYLMLLPDGDPDPSTSVQVNFQTRLSGDAILWMGPTRKIGFSNSRQYIDEASTNSKFKYAYVYDELFWEGTKVSIGLNENEVFDISMYAKSKGLRPIVSIMPSVILNSDFKMKDINAYDVIAIDIYPSVMPNEDTAGCKYNENLYTNLLYCSLDKLRRLGFKGDIWYVYQAFGIKGEDSFKLIERLKLQRETINIAETLGVEGFVPFGYYLSKRAVNDEPYLYEGHGSIIDTYVK